MSVQKALRNEPIEMFDPARIQPLMTAATEAFFRRSASVGLEQAFVEKPASMHAVIEFLEQRLRAS